MLRSLLTGSQYSPTSGVITPFPFQPTCDNDETHSPLRLVNGNISGTVPGIPGAVTYCWAVSWTNSSQCSTNAPRGSCCKQDLSAIWFEISEERARIAFA